MDFLYSNFPPVKTAQPTFHDVFYSHMANAQRMDIAVGYVTADSLAELQQAVVFNETIKTLNLIIGMHYWERFTRLEFEAASSLNKYLTAERRGEVRLSTPFRFHGKLYSYSNSAGAYAGIIGSNNLSSIVDGGIRSYEASLLIDSKPDAQKMRDFIDLLSAKCVNIAEAEITEYRENNSLLEGHEHVKKISKPDLETIKRGLTDISFSIPLVKSDEVPEKSNLNVFFGKGRLVRGTGIVQPRHWYEVELIVPNTVTTLHGYPQKDTAEAVFDVITDDGWQFKCKVSGDYSKNLRSEDDLKILGKWIKGRLENAGVLKMCQKVSAQTFIDYGRSDFTLTKTATPNLWYLNFGV